MYIHATTSTYTNTCRYISDTCNIYIYIYIHIYILVHTPHTHIHLLMHSLHTNIKHTHIRTDTYIHTSTHAHTLPSQEWSFGCSNSGSLLRWRSWLGLSEYIYIYAMTMYTVYSTYTLSYHRLPSSNGHLLVSRCFAILAS